MGASILPFWPRPSSPPAAAGARGVVVPMPTTRTHRAYLKRQGLRLAAHVGGASLVEVERFLWLHHQRIGTPPAAAARDIADALDFVRTVRDAADAIARPGPRGPGGRAA